MAKIERILNNISREDLKELQLMKEKIKAAKMLKDHDLMDEEEYQKVLEAIHFRLAGLEAKYDPDA